MGASPLNPRTSWFLDLWRTLAALAVFAYHGVYLWYPDRQDGPERVAHGAVVVFFVLSGYLIAYSTLSKPVSARDYACARLSRLLSVAVPALLLTVLLLAIGHRHFPAFYSRISRGHEGLRLMLAGLFCQNLWFMSASPPSNAPFWSLSYEFWYYALWGAWLLWGGRARVVACAVLALISGPDILLLFPCWLAGVCAYRCRQSFRLSPIAARAGGPLAIAAMLAVVHWVPPCPSGSGMPPLNQSGAFATDWLIAGLMAFAILAFDRAQANVLKPAPAAKAVRVSAASTFSLYLYHFPLLVFATAALGLTNPPRSKALLVEATIVGLVLLLSRFTEHRRRPLEQLLRSRLPGHLPNQAARRVCHCQDAGP